MEYTNNYGLNMPEYMESADIRDLNENAETIDSLLHNNFTNSADAYDSAQTYAVGDIVIYENKLYRCTTAVASAESFDSTKWTQTSLGGLLETVNGALNSLLKEQLISFSSSAPCTLTVSNYWRGEIILIGGSADFMGYYMIRVSSTGVPYIYAMKDSPVTTITPSTNTIVLSSNEYCGGYVKTVSGTCTVS